MKIYLNNWLGLAVSSVLLFTSLNSCVKNRNDLATDFSKITPIVELIAGEPITSGNPVRFKGFALDISPNPTNLNIYVNYAAPGLAPNDIDVTLALDPTGLAAYNDANGSDYQIPASDAYSLPTLKVTIKKGTRFALVPVIINTSKIDLSAQNAIPLKIVDASGVTISANNDHLIYAILVKNQWDGIYEMSGSTLRAGDADRTGTFAPIEMGLATSAGNQVTFTGLQIWANGGGVGIGNPILTIHPDNTVDVSSDGGAYNVPGSPNYYDPATKTFYLDFTWGAGPAARRATDVLVYLRPR